jgi:hypothetical protein
MENYSEEALQAAAAPGIAKAQASFDAVATEMAGRPAEEVHAELVKRLEAEPFHWDDEGLRTIAASISEASSDGDSSEDSDHDESREPDPDQSGEQQTPDT